ncbi:prolyl oligopeptidase family serine peptidase [Microbacterium sp. C7(2022)]|uniref:prolyl oligopeptidase family serine peptidase n=1 Tax=Microbacterium sp. C7(2022) TaxID=2992759 RepID=UPI00237BFE2D|nr:prolyl oligopeptidase family serine peptidase [Microbacterium sp. C7(2022)]MDE0545889.1 prolyl oligopeptidase family serine peptidase [Microbacterium sp. C7(2022)]
MTAPLPFGSWPSHVSAAAVSESSPRLERAQFVGDEIWWGQSVAAEGGRTTVMRRSGAGTAEPILPAPWNARSAVHEYGGDAWAATPAGALVFVEKTDQRIWALDGDTPRALTPELGGMRFGGLRIAGDRLLAVRETHGSGKVVRDIVSVPLDGAAASTPDALVVLASGSDFVAQPALSRDGSTLAWIAWNHPHMPWDETTLRVRALTDPDTTGTVIAGGDGSAPLQPVWTEGGELTFVDDPSGRWNLCRVRPGEQPRPLAPADADTGGGLWVLGSRWFGSFADGRIVAVRTNGSDHVVLVEPDGAVSPLDVDVVSNTVIEDVSGTRVLISGTARDGAATVWDVDIDSPASPTRVAGGGSSLTEEWMPRAQPLTVSGPHGPVHAFDYPPTHPEVVGPADERPPYVVFVHGGPTAHVGGAPSAKIAYFTSRGIGVLDVNYGGSTGYGRAYRERLRGMWGVVDVDDVIAAARGLADAGRADARRLAIAGGSAGGWTVLCALANSDVFSAGISRYGVADLRLLAEDTHDFEARYLDSLVGPLPEAEQLYIDRSPLSHLEGFTTPMLIEQGLDDHVVPPSQSEAVRDALAGNGVPHAYLAFEGEGHGFRRAETIVATLEAEVAFLGEVFGFTPDGIAPIVLD